MHDAHAMVPGWSCLRCGHTWPAKLFDAKGRPIKPKNCANKKCKSPYWDTPRGQKRGPPVGTKYKKGASK